MRRARAGGEELERARGGKVGVARAEGVVRAGSNFALHAISPCSLLPLVGIPPEVKSPLSGPCTH